MNVDGRSRAKANLQKKLGKVAISLVEENDSSYIIETGKGKRLSPAEIEINTKVSLACAGSSVDCKHAWQELLEYYIELEGDGFLAQ